MGAGAAGTSLWIRGTTARYKLDHPIGIAFRGSNIEREHIGKLAGQRCNITSLHTLYFVEEAPQICLTWRTGQG